MKIPSFLSFHGTANRGDFWVVTIAWAFVDALIFLGYIFALLSVSEPLNYLCFLALGVIAIMSVWATLVVAARRFRDLSMSPWYSCLYFIPYIGWVLVWIPCGFISGKRFKTRRRTISNSPGR